jgi:hypothetical protein
MRKAEGDGQTNQAAIGQKVFHHDISTWDIPNKKARFGLWTCKRIGGDDILSI